MNGSSTVVNGAVLLAGSPAAPRLELQVSSWSRLPGRALTYQEWAKGLPGRRWDGEAKRWVITGLGPGDPVAVLSAAGLAVQYPQSGPLAGWRLADLVDPVAVFSPEDAGLLLVRPRLAGFEECLERIGWGATWVKGDEWFELPVAEAVRDGRLRPGVVWPEGALEAGLAARAATAVPRSGEVRAFAAALGCTADGSEIGSPEQLAPWLAKVPDWFGLELFPFQRFGALAAMLGHGFLAPPPGLGKTRMALAVAAMCRAERVLVLCPPVMVSAWAQQARESGIATGGGAREGMVVAVNPRRKMPELPASGVVVVPDSTVAARDGLRAELIEWDAQVIVYDEAHRAMTLGSKRTGSALELAAASRARGAAGVDAAGVRRMRLPLTGTPMLANPVQLLPQLEFSGHLYPVFGSRDDFLRRYCQRDRRGKFRAGGRARLAELGARLAAEVWVRPEKARVLPFLPAKSRVELPVAVPLGAYREAHREVLAKIDAWLAGWRAEHGGADPGPEAVSEFAQAGLALISQLREAAGVCKVPAAVEWIEQVHDFEADGDGGFGSPLVVWTHHQAVTDAVVAALPESLGPVGVIRGGTSQVERDRLVEGFQACRVAVLVCSITAAGVGITLTRGCRSLFVETDWTPALIEQAEDRQSRIGQTRPVVVTTMVAEGTLDEHVQAALKRKGHVLGAVFGGRADVSVSRVPVADLLTSTRLLEEMVAERLRRG